MGVRVQGKQAIVLVPQCFTMHCKQSFTCSRRQLRPGAAPGVTMAAPLPPPKACVSRPAISTADA